MQNICYFIPDRLSLTSPFYYEFLVLIMPYTFAISEQNILKRLFQSYLQWLFITFNRNKYLQGLYSNVSFLRGLSVALRSHSGQYRPGEAYVGLSPLIAIPFRCHLQKSKKVLFPACCSTWAATTSP